MNINILTFKSIFFWQLSVMDLIRTATRFFESQFRSVQNMLCFKLRWTKIGFILNINFIISLIHVWISIFHSFAFVLNIFCIHLSCICYCLLINFSNIHFLQDVSYLPFSESSSLTYNFQSKTFKTMLINFIACEHYTS
jgi:hypothetical protein